MTLLATIGGLAQGPAVSKEPSPLAACPNGTQTGKNYVSAEVEPSLAVNGTQMIGLFHQDRWSNGGGHGIGVVYNNGTGWNQTTLGSDMCDTAAGTPLNIYQRSSDPWVSFSKDGKTAYASALSFNNTNNFNAVVAGSSTDGGATWTMTAIPGSIFTQSNQSTDKNATTADPTDKTNKTAYTVWDTLLGPTDQPDDNPHAQAYTGPAYFSKTNDRGKTWSQAQIIINTGNRQQTIGNIIVVDPNNGTLYDFTDLILPPNTPFKGTRSNAQLAFVKSTDGGANWSQPQIIAPFNSLGVVDPNDTTKRLRVGDGLEEVAIDAKGKIYVVWESSTNFAKNVNQTTGLWDDEILMATSSDGGKSWTGPTVVHHLDSGLPTYTPTVAVNGDRVAVTYYDNRFLKSGQTNALPTDYWVSVSTAGGPFVEQRITTKSFDQLSAPFARGFFLGDYEGLQPSGDGFEAMFVRTNCEEPYTDTSSCGPANYTGRVPESNNKNPTDVFVAAIS